MLAPTDYQITEAENGEQALAAVAKQRPADDSPKGLRKIGEAISRYLVDRAHKEIY
jgi:CheY-like chemotaxis protein